MVTYISTQTCLGIRCGNLCSRYQFIHPQPTSYKNTQLNAMPTKQTGPPGVGAAQQFFRGWEGTR